MKSYSGDEFVKALNSERGLAPSHDPLSSTGFVKSQGPEVTDVILFSPGRDCGSWIPVPLEHVEKVEHLGMEPCGDHSHPYVRIHFRPAVHPEAVLYASLLRSTIDRGGPALGWGWKPPWTWSRCAKCKLEVNLFITGTVFAATAGTGPGALAVASALIEGAYGAAAWEAVKEVIFSASVDEISRRICKATGKC